VIPNFKILYLNYLKLDFMEIKNNAVAIPDEIIMQKIYLVRGKNVMLDQDLAELYNVDTKQLK
jgi:hypothetical protein